MTATLPPHADVRECRLYRFWVAHPVTGETVLGYVGETGRQPFERLLEHLATQPWFDTVVRWEIDPAVYWGKTAVLEAETRAIRTELPLYNVKGNEQNRKRIIPPDAIRQRRARDAAKKDPRWVHPDDRGPIAQSARPVPAARSAHPWIRPACIWSGAWVLVAAVTWGYLAPSGLDLSWTTEALSASLTATTMCLWGFAGAPITRRQRRAARRRVGRWVRRWWGQ